MYSRSPRPSVSKSARVSAADLPQAGDAGLHRQPAAMPQVVALDLARERRPRADEAHLAAQHVQELRQLVEARASQEPARPS